MRTQHVLVTGASGFVGQALCAQLVQSGAAVRGSYRGVKANATLAEGVEQISVSTVNEATDWSAALISVNVIVHLAARVHVMMDTEPDPLTAFRTVNVDGTLNLARQAANAGVRRFVFISSIKVNGEITPIGQGFTELDTPKPSDDYGLSKLEAELALLQLSANSGMELVIIRPPLVYGFGVKANFASLVRAVNRGWPLPLGAVHNQRSFISLNNLVDFIVFCINHPQAANQTFLVSDGQDLSTTELVRGMADAARVPLRLLPVPAWALQKAASLIGKGDVAQRLFGNLQVNISKARKMLNWHPPVSVSEGLRQAMGAGDR